MFDLTGTLTARATRNRERARNAVRKTWSDYVSAQRWEKKAAYERHRQAQFEFNAATGVKS